MLRPRYHQQHPTTPHNKQYEENVRTPQKHTHQSIFHISMTGCLRNLSVFHNIPIHLLGCHSKIALSVASVRPLFLRSGSSATQLRWFAANPVRKHHEENVLPGNMPDEMVEQRTTLLQQGRLAILTVSKISSLLLRIVIVKGG